MYDEALEAAILDNPTLDAFSIYGDWFADHGHPRGELIALQVEYARAKQRRDKETARALQHMASALLASETPALGGALPHVEPQWYCGFWQSVTVDCDHVDLATVLAHPSARVLKTLRLRAEGWDCATLTRTFDDELGVRASTLDGIARMMRADRDARRWWPALPALQRLRLGAVALVLVDRELREMNGHAIASIHGLAELFLNTRAAFWQRVSGDALRALAPASATLRVLAAAMCPSLDDGTCAMLSRFARLEELHVASTSVTCAGLGHLSRLPRLRLLDVRACKLGDNAEQILATFPALKTVRR